MSVKNVNVLLISLNPLKYLLIFMKMKERRKYIYLLEITRIDA